MNTDFDQRLRSIRSWTAQADDAGWLIADDLRTLDKIETRSAEDLFGNARQRPLIIGLFGGTGVGKSSLLNMLAGESVARTGVERPTSRQATIYLHRTQELSALPDGSPIEDTVVKYHGSADKQDVAWLDMPDIDSVERTNRDVVEAWLPYIDWLIYVVSPERYRDDEGWQLVRQRHRHHHWLFVINRWDEAAGQQVDQFIADLEGTGFDHPTVLRTSCAGDDRYDFDQLERTVTEAIAEHGLAELQRIGVAARLEELDAVSRGLMAKLGDKEQWSALQIEVERGLEHRLDLFEQRLGSQIEGVVQHYPPAPVPWRREPTRAGLPDLDLEKEIWSDYCEDLLDNIALDACNAADDLGISCRPLSSVIRGTLASARQVLIARLGKGLHQSLNEPGTALRRGTRKLMEVLSLALPVAVGGWAGYHAVQQYRRGLAGEADFLGFNFAIHSLLLIGLAWLLPFVVSRWLRPSYRASALRGLRHGLNDAITIMRRELKEALDDLSEKRSELIHRFPRL